MANISNVKENLKKAKTFYKKFLGLDEGVVQDEFEMTIEGYSDIRYLVQNVQIPELKRENAEGNGPWGVMFKQQTRYDNAVDVTVTFKETIKGIAYKALRDWVINKKYLTVKLALTGESFSEGIDELAVTLEDCWIEIDGVDLAVDSATELVKPSGTIHANWVNWQEVGAENPRSDVLRV